MARVVTVEIAGQRYPIRSDLDERYVARLAAYVDQKLRTAAGAAPTSDGMGLAVLVALNIADEYFRARETAAPAPASADISERALRLEKLLDDALAEVGVHQDVSAP